MGYRRTDIIPAPTRGRLGPGGRQGGGHRHHHEQHQQKGRELRIAMVQQDGDPHDGTELAKAADGHHAAAETSFQQTRVAQDGSKVPRVVDVSARATTVASSTAS